MLYERLDDARILIIGVASSFFLHGTHLKVNLPEGLDACGAFAFEARIYLKDADFRFPWPIE